MVRLLHEEPAFSDRFISYGGLKINSALLSIVLHD